MPASDAAAPSSTVDIFAMAAFEQDPPNDPDEEVRDLGEDLTGTHARDALARLAARSEAGRLRLTASNLQHVDAYGGAVVALAIYEHLANGGREVLLHAPPAGACRDRMSAFFPDGQLLPNAHWVGKRPSPDDSRVVLPVFAIGGGVETADPVKTVDDVMVIVNEITKPALGHPLRGLLESVIEAFLETAGRDDGHGTAPVFCTAEQCPGALLLVVARLREPAPTVGLTEGVDLNVSLLDLVVDAPGYHHEVIVAAGTKCLRYRSEQAVWQREDCQRLPGFTGGIEVARRAPVR